MEIEELRRKLTEDRDKLSKQLEETDEDAQSYTSVLGIYKVAGSIATLNYVLNLLDE